MWNPTQLVLWGLRGELGMVIRNQELGIRNMCVAGQR